MRAFCTVSAPLEVCASSAEQLSPGSRFLALRLLGNQQPKTLYFLVDAKSRVREVYTQTCLHFATQGMLDTELFGLAVLIDGEYMFADPESKLSKYGPKSWRSSHTHGLDANGRPLLELHFRVQFYIESPFMLKDETSRHNYYLQLKYNALQRDIPKEYSDQSMLLLAGLALQADLGDAPNIITTPASTSASSTSSINNTTTNGNTATALNTKAENNSSHDVSSITTPASASAATTTTGTNSILPITAAETISTTSIMTKTTTTLPKINRRTNSNSITTSSSSNEKLLRLSTTFAKPTNHLATTSTTLTSTSTSSTSSASASAVFPISGSLKRSLNVVAATLSPLSSTMSINRNVSMSTTTTSQPGAVTAAAVPTHHTSSTQINYFRLEDYLPVGLRNTWAASALRACHRENHGMSSADAELHYIQQACLIHESINAHTYRMRMVKSEQGPGNSWFVVYAKGIKIYGVSDVVASQQITFSWPNITKLSFERKKFEIRSGDSKITLYATSDEKNKMLLTLCKETHQFSMKIAARLKEVIKREEEENNCLHACYIYSRSLHLPYKNKNDQRISVISSTSSNTTSGIVSDRVHSEDELEIMINTPPAPIAAPSTESLALAHLLDRPSVSRQTSSVGQVSLKELEDQLVALSVRQQQQQQQQQQYRESPTELSNTSAGNSSTSSSFPTTIPRHNTDSSTATDSPSSQHNVGSQCSSTCSTVVVALPSDCNSTGSPLASLAVHSLGNSGGGASPTTNGNRRNSTSSSLELGFSHTAQNSTLSEAASTCHEHDFITTPSRLVDETESVSGVYTLAHGAPPTETSGVYTMHSSEMTGQSSEIAESESQASSHYGIFQPSKSVISDPTRSITLDSVDGGNDVNGNGSDYRGKRIKNEEFRLRSDSNVSTSGSFRGDGSDPTDKKHALLSAEELTELIVGRGTYPCRKTVSNTLDSDCDYVTLPLTMAGDSYIQGHQDTAPSEEDHVVDDLMDVLLPTDPPAPPQRIDSNASNLSNIRVRSPPPYNARHEKTGLCGPPVRISSQLNKVVPIPAASVPNVSNVPSSTKSAPVKKPATTGTKTTVTQIAPITSAAILRRDPPPYPNSTKPRPTSLVSLGSTSSSSALRHAALTTARESHPPTSVSTTSMNSLKSEEITARFITTRPQINILKAHTSVVSENPKPCYAAPTHCSISGATSSTGSVASNYLSHNSNYVSSATHPLRTFNVTAHHHHQHHHPPPPPVPAVSSQLSAAAAAHVAAAAAAGAGVIPSTIGIPIVPYSFHAAHKSMSSLHQQPPPPPPPYPDMKPSPRTCVLLPVIKPRQYLPPPPPSLPRQPPPPPPPQLATMYAGHLARKQLELYQQQLYSDVDYVIYPIQDPAVSQQEYLDAKQSSLLAAMAQSPPPHPYFAYHHHHHHTGTHAGAWDTCKAHAIYRSTPYLPLALSTHSRYASTQNLSDTYIQLPGTYSPLYSPSVASMCSSYEPPPPPPLHPGALAAMTTTASSSNLFARSRSDDNILNSIDSLPKVKRLPPPPPPPYVNRRLKKPPMPAPSEKPPPIPSKPTPVSTPSLSLNNINSRTHLSSHKPPTLRTHSSKSHMTKTSSGAQWAGERPKPDSALSRGGVSGDSSSILSHLQASVAAANKAAMNAAATASKSTATTPGRTVSTTIAPASVAAANDIDIALLREKSKILDLPLITALCNDRSLLKQTKAFVPPKNSRNSFSTATTAASATTALATTTITVTPATSVGNHIFSKSVTNINSSLSATTSMNGSITPVVTSQQIPSATITLATPTGNKLTATTSLTKPRKTSISHRHPNDKLPPLPMQLAEANNYVMDPALLKHHKSYNSQT